MRHGEPRTCLACGLESSAVRMTIVEYPDPLPVEVAVLHNVVAGRGAGSIEYRTVPGRYGAEWRCTDRTGCAARAATSAVDDFFAG